MNIPKHDVIIFLHIPKTGGTTLSRIIEHQYDADAIQECWMQRPETVRQFLALTPEEKQRIRCLQGHFPFGIHERLPGRAAYITLLRKPVSLFASSYAYNVSHPEDSYGWNIPQEALRSPETYIDYCITHEYINYQTGLLGHSRISEIQDFAPRAAKASASSLEQAQQNISRHFAVVGLTHRYLESALLMKRRCEWSGRLTVFRQRVTRSATKAVISRPLRNKIEQYAHLDTQLLRFAEVRLDEAIEKEGPFFQKELAVLRRKQRILDALQTWGRRIPRWLRRGLYR